MANGATAQTLMPVPHRVAVRTAKVTSRRWPATMLAQSRMASEKGRTTNVDTSSMGVTIT